MTEEIIVENVIPAVCATCKNKENGGGRKIVCSLDKSKTVGAYSSCSDGCPTNYNIYTTCNKWGLSSKVVLEKGATIIYHSSLASLGL